MFMNGIFPCAAVEKQNAFALYENRKAGKLRPRLGRKMALPHRGFGCCIQIWMAELHEYCRHPSLGAAALLIISMDLSSINVMDSIMTATSFRWMVTTGSKTVSKTTCYRVFGLCWTEVLSTVVCCRESRHAAKPCPRVARLSFRGTGA